MNELKNEDIEFNTVCEEWLYFKKNKVKESSYLNYKFIIDKHLKNDFSNKQISYFKEYDLNKYIDKLKEKLASQELKNIGILISLYSGLRIGEICSLKWSNIDFESKLIYVNHTMQRVYIEKDKTQVIITEPKTKKSIRKIPIAKTLYNKLKEISVNYSKDDYILTRKKR